MNPDPSQTLARLFAEDQAEHARVPPFGSSDYHALRERDRERRHAAADAIRELRRTGTVTAEHLYQAAWLFNHGDTAADARQSHELASEAARGGYAPARWLSAASWDRWHMYEGRPQKYGTQIVPDGAGYRVWDTDARTTDAERALLDVPPLAKQHERAAAMIDPQPPMDQAPEWMKSALARWQQDRSSRPATGPDA